MKCKIFCNDDYDYLEDNVNDWLDSNKIEITHIKQSIDSDNNNVVLTIFYLTEKELRKKKLDKINDNDTDN